MSIPTAEEFFFDYSIDYEYDNLSVNCKQEITHKAIEFAKLHVQAALKEASQNISMIKECGNKDDNNCLAVFCYNCLTIVDNDSILNAYPLTLIK